MIASALGCRRCCLLRGVVWGVVHALLPRLASRATILHRICVFVCASGYCTFYADFIARASIRYSEMEKLCIILNSLRVGADGPSDDGLFSDTHTRECECASVYGLVPSDYYNMFITHIHTKIPMHQISLVYRN